MSRVFGDFCLKDYGVISVPEITHRRIIDDDEFVVLATHGVRYQSFIYHHSPVLHYILLSLA